MKSIKEMKVMDLSIWEQMILEKIHGDERLTHLVYTCAMNLPVSERRGTNHE